MIVANHVGSPDIFILGACLKGFFVSKAEISDWPFFNLLAWLGMTIFADRKHKRQVRSIIEKIESRLNCNCSVILFPEGQATDGTDPDTLFVKYFKTASDGAQIPFTHGETITSSNTSTAVVASCHTGAAAQIKQGVYLSLIHI